jgi:hypothetical protein
MLLFHGTRGDRALVESIAAEGLRAVGRAWTHAVLGREECAFLSNAPVAGHGGDPVAFAMGFPGWPRRAQYDGWIVVVDLPNVARNLVRAVIPNLDLERYFERDRHFAWLAAETSILDRGEWSSGGPPVVEVLHELGARGETKVALRPMLRSKDNDLHSDDFSFARWRRYADALRNARTLDDVVRAGRRCGFTWDHPEVPHCELCVAAMATWSHAIDTPLECAGGRPVALPVFTTDFASDGLESLVRTVTRWFEGTSMQHRFDALRSARRVRSELDYERLLRILEIDEARLPPAWRRDFGRTFTDDDLRAADVQLVCDAIPNDYVIGALRIATGGRLRTWARPERGETLLEKLWSAARELRRISRGPRTVYDG